MQYLNGKGHLPTEEEMLQDVKRDFGKRVSFGWPNKKAHSILGHLHPEYFEDLANTANIPKTPEVLLKIYEDIYQRRAMDPIGYRNDNYRISASDFERTSSTSEEIYKSN